MHRHRGFLVILSLTIGLLVAACASPASQAGSPATQGASPTATSVVASPTVATPTATTYPGAAATPTDKTASTGASIVSSSGITFTVASGTTADYRVREQLASLSAPSDAVGKTSAVTGSIVVTPDGKVVSDQSKITVTLTSLQSDSGMRDRFVLGNTLQTSTYPTAVFVPTEIQGLPVPLPTTGQQSFQLVGNLTVHGVTKPVTWAVTSQVQGGDVTGQATTSVKFEDFGMTQPRVAAVLSVTDDVKLEITFHLSAGG